MKYWTFIDVLPCRFFPVSGCSADPFFIRQIAEWNELIDWCDAIVFFSDTPRIYHTRKSGLHRLRLSACARVTWSVIKWLPRRLTRQVIKIFCNQSARALNLSDTLADFPAASIYVICATNERFVKAPGKTFCVTQIPPRLPKQCTQRVKSKTDPFRGIYARCHFGMSCGGSRDFTHNQLDVQRYTPNKHMHAANENGQQK